MTRGELTVPIMREMGWRPTNPNDLRLKDIVFNIKKCWKYLRCVTGSEVYTSDEFGMCSTYRVYSHREDLEVSMDNKRWYKVAYRLVEYARQCKYAD